MQGCPHLVRAKHSQRLSWCGWFEAFKVCVMCSFKWHQAHLKVISKSFGCWVYCALTSPPSSFTSHLSSAVAGLIVRYLMSVPPSSSSFFGLEQLTKSSKVKILPSPTTWDESRWLPCVCVCVCVLIEETFCARCRHLTLCVCVCVCVCVCLLQYESSGLGLISSRLRTTLNRIQESLIDMVRLDLCFSLSPHLSPFSLSLFNHPSLPHRPSHSLTQTCSLSCGPSILSPLYASVFFRPATLSVRTTCVPATRVTTKCIMGHHYPASVHSHVHTPPSV